MEGRAMDRVREDGGGAGVKAQRRISATVAEDLGGKPQRWITAPIDEDLFRSVGAFCKRKDRQVGDVVQAALHTYLKNNGWKLATAGDGEPAAA
jgi:hypothetical protein